MKILSPCRYLGGGGRGEGGGGREGGRVRCHDKKTILTQRCHIKFRGVNVESDSTVSLVAAE